MRSLIFVIGLTLSAAHEAGTAGEDVKVIAHSGVRVNEISVDDLRAVFLGTRTSLKSAGVVRPVLGRDQASLRRFAASYLGKSVAALETYYRSQMFTGKAPLPVGFVSEEEVVDYVARTPGAIGFVRESTPGGAVKTLRVTRAP